MKTKLFATVAALGLIASAADAQNALFLRAYLKATNTETLDYFGAVDASADFVVAGASGEDSAATGVNGNASDNSASNAGAAYVRHRLGTPELPVWVNEAYLKASNTGAGDEFGASVAVSGDWIAIGAPGEDSAATGQNGNQNDNSSTDSGAVYIFRRVLDNGQPSWVQEAYLKPATNHASASYGQRVAIDNGVLVVGAPGDSSNAVGINGSSSGNNRPQSGAAYIYRRTTIVGQPAWLLEAYVKAPSPSAYDGFGHAVGVQGTRVIVGAPYEDSSAVGVNGTPNENATNAGAAYIYTSNGSGSGSTWALSAFLKAGNAEANDYFGYSVAVDGTRAAVGAIFEDSASSGVDGDQAGNGATDAGAAYLYSLHVGPIFQLWQQDHYLKAQYPQSSAYFGSALALDGGLLLVGSEGERSGLDGVDAGAPDTTADDSGAVYAYEWTGVPAQRAYMKAPASHMYELYGRSVAISGPMLFVGATGESSSATGENGDYLSMGAYYAGAVFGYSFLADCDANGVPDYDEMGRDCDSDGIMDGCEIAAGTPDCDGNTVPDSCQPDTNFDGIADICQGGVAYCFGTTCPCGNNGQAGRGCANSQSLVGAQLVSTGLPSVAYDSLVLSGSGMTGSSSVLYFQGTTAGSGSAFGDGLRCATGSIIRLGASTNVQGQSSWPRPGMPAIHIGGNIPAAGGLRTYQAWYRDANQAFCTASTFNLTNGVRVLWLP